MANKPEDFSKLNEFVQYLRENPGKHKKSALAQHFDVHRQQIHRWIKYADNRHGIFIDDNESNPDLERGEIALTEEPSDLFKITLEREEIDALATAASRFENLSPLAIQALEKLVEVKRVAGDVLQDSIVYTPLSDQYDPFLFSRVAKAIRDRRVATLSYTNSQGITKSYEFNSYILIPHDFHLHLVGVSHNSLKAGFNTVIRLRLDQISSFELTIERFKQPNFDVRSYASKEFGVLGTSDSELESVDVIVQFSAEKAQYIRRTMRHESQVVTDLEDGSVTWKIHVPINDALVAWIIGYGQHAKVLEPIALQKRVVQWVTNIQNTYL